MFGTGELDFVDNIMDEYRYLNIKKKFTQKCFENRDC